MSLSDLRGYTPRGDLRGTPNLIELGQLADLAKVPAAQRQAFRLDISKLIRGARPNSARKSSPKSDTSVKRGRPAKSWPGQPGFGEPDRFIYFVLAAVMVAGGKLTLDEKNKSGTLVEFLNLVSTHLPPKFMPPAYHNRLRRIREELSRQIRLGKTSRAFSAE